ncbi:C25 family peptidase propeptide domain-containing protein [Prolixibacteraceae bacterium]|nr:C25 family peptidase propeptide domain-containing protein [Prolixibacteraceae bacterium]
MNTTRALFRIMLCLNIVIFFSSCGVTQDYKDSSYLSALEPRLGTSEIYKEPIGERKIYNDYIDVTYSFFGGKIVRRKSPVGDLYYMHIPRVGKMGKEGLPALPMRNDLFEIPIDASPSIEIMEVVYVTYDNLLIYPAQPPISDVYGAEASKFYIDDEYYSSNRWYPSPIAQIYSDQRASEKRYIRVLLGCAQQCPKKRQLRVFSKIKYRIHLYKQE